MCTMRDTEVTTTIISAVRLSTRKPTEKSSPFMVSQV